MALPVQGLTPSNDLHVVGFAAQQIRAAPILFWSWLAMLLMTIGWQAASAHDVPGTAVYVDIDDASAVVQMDVPLAELNLALPKPLQVLLKPALLSNPAAVDALAGYIDSHFQVRDANGVPLSQQVEDLSIQHILDGDCLVARLRLESESGTKLDSLQMHDDMIVHQVLSHKIYVFLRRDFRQGLIGDNPQLIDVLYAWKQDTTLQRTGGSWWNGAKKLFALGMHHIASGSDHLLFLLTLLLVVPLRSHGRQWQTETMPLHSSLRRAVGIVSGFTVGHSITLALAATGGFPVPVKWIEVLVAVSILVSAIHAFKPIYPGKELWVAAGFGVVHGLAFAEALAGFGYSAGVLASSLLAFNIGIEVKQLTIVATCLPWLFLLARTSWYAWLRVPVASLSGVAAIGWIGARALALPNPVEPWVTTIAAQWLWILLGLAGVSLLAAAIRRRRAALPCAA